MKETVLIPAYMPDEKLTDLLCSVRNSGLDAIVVDDGSPEEYSGIFEMAEKYAKVIHHDRNRGKGAALKTGISYIVNNHPECKYFITADADGQHRISDILKVREALRDGASFVLTERALNGNIPFLSKLGNSISRVVYSLMAGRYFCDNQSGLRGFATENHEWLLKVGGDRYDYELSMVYYADKQNIEITTIPIETVYIDDNKASHFDPLKDTARIYKQLFKHGCMSVLTLFLWECAAILSDIFLSDVSAAFHVFASGIVCALLCILLSKYVSFSSVNYKDGMRTFACAAMRSSFCCALCLLSTVFSFSLPVVLVFNAALIVCAFLEYNLYKLVYTLSEAKAFSRFVRS